VTLDLGFVRQHLDPRHAVGIGPHGVVDAREVHGELAAAFLEEVRQEKAHLEEGQRYSRGISSSLHTLAGGGIMGGAGTALFQALGAVPPGEATAPMRTTTSSRARATSQPKRLPAEALRQTWLERAPPHRPISLRHLLDAGGGQRRLGLGELRRC